MYTAAPTTVRITRAAVLTAAAVVLALSVRFPLLPGASFLLYEPSDVPLLIGAVLLGPGWTAGVAGAVAVLMGAIGGGGIIGSLSRFAGSAALGITTAWAYRYLRTRSWGLTASAAVGVLAYTLIEVLMTLLLGPLFLGNMQAAIAMVVPVVLPFNLIKGTLNAALALFLYTLLRRLGWLQKGHEPL